MSLSTGRSQLFSSMKTCNEHWEETKRYWHDPVCQDFEETWLVPLAEEVEATLRAIDRLANVLEAMRRDCES